MTSSARNAEPYLALKLDVNASCNVSRSVSASKVNATFVTGGAAGVTAVLAVVVLVIFANVLLPVLIDAVVVLASAGLGYAPILASHLAPVHLI